MLSRLPKLAIVAALACALGLHWSLLQSVAWVGMVVSYSQDRPLTEALEKTFNGKHPCSLCKEIAKARQTEKKPESAPPEGKKFEFSYSATAFIFTAPSHYWEVRYPDDASEVLAHAPPVPPPRQLPG